MAFHCVTVKRSDRCALPSLWWRSDRKTGQELIDTFRCGFDELNDFSLAFPLSSISAFVRIITAIQYPHPPTPGWERDNLQFTIRNFFILNCENFSLANSNCHGLETSDVIRRLCVERAIEYDNSILIVIR